MSTLLRNANDATSPLAGIEIGIERSTWLAASSPMPFCTLTPAVATPAAAACALSESGDECDNSDNDQQSTVVG